MALILSLDTATPQCSVSLSSDGKVLGEKKAEHNNEHARLLTVLIQQLLDELNIPITTIDAVAYSAGPGSYTGLRIGGSVAKGLCFTLEKPLIAVPSLALVAHTFFQKEANAEAITVLAPARKGQCYVADFQKPVSCKEEVCLWNMADSLKDHHALAAHSSAKEAWSVVDIALVNSVMFHETNPSAMAHLSLQLFRAKQFADLAYSEPYYVGGWGRSGV